MRTATRPRRRCGLMISAYWKVRHNLVGAHTSVLDTGAALNQNTICRSHADFRGRNANTVSCLPCCNAPSSRSFCCVYHVIGGQTLLPLLYLGLPLVAILFRTGAALTGGSVFTVLTVCSCACRVRLQGLPAEARPQRRHGGAVRGGALRLRLPRLPGDQRRAGPRGLHWKWQCAPAFSMLVVVNHIC